MKLLKERVYKITIEALTVAESLEDAQAEAEFIKELVKEASVDSVEVTTEFYGHIGEEDENY